jgi:hypothetical protein
MKAVRSKGSLLWERLLAAAVAAALLSTLIPTLAHSYNTERMEKDIAIMENVINTAMVESELVYVFDVNTNVRGLYVPEFGALFTLHAQLTSNWASPYLTSWQYYGGQNPGSPFWSIYQMDREKLGKLVDKLDITVNGKKVNLDEYFQNLQEYEVDREDRTITVKKIKEMQEQKHAKKQELIDKNLEQYKEELAGIVADYGGTIRQLDNDQWVMVVAYMGSSHKTTTINKLMVKVKKADIDRYDRGDIDYEELRSRIVIEME